MEEFVNSLEQMADVIQKAMDGMNMENRILTINVCPSGRTVSCYEFNSGDYDFYSENVPSYHGWRDVTKDRNRVRAQIKDALEDDLK